MLMPRRLFLVEATVAGMGNCSISNAVLRLAFINDAQSSQAVQNATLALASLLRYGMHVQTAELKIAALGALRNATVNKSGTQEDIQQAAACMLLSNFEVCLLCRIVNHWHVL
jgi:hypothetical protein